MKTVAVAACAAFLLAGCAAHSRTAGSRRSTTIGEASVRGHMGFFASDAMNGRGSGTRDEWIAAIDIGSQLRRWGVEPLGDDGGFVQAVELSRTQIGAPPVLTAQGLRLTHGKEMIVQGLAGLRVSGPLQKFQRGATVAAGAIVLLPDGIGPEAAAAIQSMLEPVRWPANGVFKPEWLPGKRP